MTQRSRACTLIGGLAILALLATSPARADLTGDNINGMLNFRMLNEGPDQFSQPSGTAPTTFQFADASNVDTATFTANPLTVEDQITDIGCGGGMSFTDTSNALPSLTLVSTGFPTNSLTYALTGDTITPGFAGALGPADFIAVFDIGTNAPEPGSLALFGAGLIGVEVTRRRRFGSTRRQ